MIFEISPIRILYSHKRFNILYRSVFIMFKFHTNEFEIVQIVSVMHEDIILSETN